MGPGNLFLDDSKCRISPRCVLVLRVETELDARATSCSLAFKAAERRRASALFFRVVQFSTPLIMPI
jgi:hypothetical protein